MKSETKATFWAIISLDDEVDSARASQSLSVLNGCETHSEELVSVLRISEVAKLLGVASWTVHQYASQGLLEKVYGGGQCLLGISRASYVNFTEKNSRSEDRDIPSTNPMLASSQKRTAERKSRVRKIRWAMHLPQNASRTQRLIAADDYLREHPEVSNRMACEAAGINRFGYSYHKLRSKGDVGIYASRRKKIAGAIIKIFPDKRTPVNVLDLRKRLTKLGLTCCLSTLYSILDGIGYVRRRYQRHPNILFATTDNHPASVPSPRSISSEAKRGPYKVTRIRRQKTLELIRKLYPDKSQSVVISQVRGRLISAGTPLTTYMTIRAILLDAGYTIFGQHTSPLRYRSRTDSGKRSIA